MKAHLIDTHLLVPRLKSSAKVKVKYQGHVSQKMGVSGALVFHKHILFSHASEVRDEKLPGRNLTQPPGHELYMPPIGNTYIVLKYIKNI